MKIAVAITGASGSIYAQLLLQKLSHLKGKLLANQVQGTAGFKPFDLLFIIGMVHFDLICFTISMINTTLIACLVQNLVRPMISITSSSCTFIIIFFVGKGQCQHTLLFQVCFVNTGKAFYQDSTYAQMRGSMAACSREEPSP
jgi:hypothetical protein